MLPRCRARFARLNQNHGAMVCSILAAAQQQDIDNTKYLIVLVIACV